MRAFILALTIFWIACGTNDDPGFFGIGAKGENVDEATLANDYNHATPFRVMSSTSKTIISLPQVDGAGAAVGGRPAGECTLYKNEPIKTPIAVKYQVVVNVNGGATLGVAATSPSAEAIQIDFSSGNNPGVQYAKRERTAELLSTVCSGSEVSGTIYYDAWYCPPEIFDSQDGGPQKALCEEVFQQGAFDDVAPCPANEPGPFSQTCSGCDLANSSCVLKAAVYGQKKRFVESQCQPRTDNACAEKNEYRQCLLPEPQLNEQWTKNQQGPDFARLTRDQMRCMGFQRCVNGAFGPCLPAGNVLSESQIPMAASNFVCALPMSL